MAKSKKNLNLLVVAHPDDETIFFAGLLLQSKGQFRVVCVTDGNADGFGPERAKQFAKACRLLGVKEFVQLDYPDRFHTRIDIEDLRRRLTEMGRPKKVYTHGPLGEYGHPHHQDVCLATHLAFQKTSEVWSIAHNCQPEKLVPLSAKDFSVKTKILKDVYFGETKRFIHTVPATPAEFYARFDLKEVRAIHQYFSSSEPLKDSRLKKYRWFKPYFETYREVIQSRPF